MLSLDVVQLIQIFLLPKINPSPNLSHTARSFTKLNFAFSLPPHPSPQPFGTQFHSTQLRFVGSASVLKEREYAVVQLVSPR